MFCQIHWTPLQHIFHHFFCDEPCRLMNMLLFQGRILLLNPKKKLRTVCIINISNIFRSRKNCSYLNFFSKQSLHEIYWKRLSKSPSINESIINSLPYGQHQWTTLHLCTWLLIDQNFPCLNSLLNLGHDSWSNHKQNSPRQQWNINIPYIIIA